MSHTLGRQIYALTPEKSFMRGQNWQYLRWVTKGTAADRRSPSLRFKSFLTCYHLLLGKYQARGKSSEHKRHLE